MIDTISVDDFYQFQTLIRKYIKYIADNPDKKIILSANRDINKSIYRQIAYTINLVDTDKLHIIDPKDIPDGGFAVPYSPDCPEIEEDDDPTQ